MATYTKRGDTVTVEFDNAIESAAFLRAVGMVQGADAIERAQAKKVTINLTCVDGWPEDQYAFIDSGQLSLFKVKEGG